MSPTRIWQPQTANGVLREMSRLGTDSSGCDKWHLNVFAGGRRWRDELSVESHPLQMKLDGLADQLLRLFASVPCGPAAGEVWHVSAGACLRLFQQNGVSQDGLLHVKPAWRRMLRSVFLSKSRAGFPATVTVPGFVGWWNWRWLPYLTDHHPIRPSRQTWRHSSRRLPPPAPPIAASNRGSVSDAPDSASQRRSPSRVPSSLPVSLVPRTLRR